MNLEPLRIGLERNFEGRSLAWALDLPGVFAFGKIDTEAVLKIPDAVKDYRTWIEQHGQGNWLKITHVKTQVAECVEDSTNDENTVFRAFFEDDRKPLIAIEIDRALQMHAWQRQDLLAGVADLSPEIMTCMLPGERWNINGILNHIGRMETLYLRNLRLPLSKAEIPVHNPFKLLELSAELVKKHLPALEGKIEVTDQGGELWSGRKLVRHLLWHQKDHMDHIQQIVVMANQQ
jgi:uncharacterized damage-inducible protein DinB